MNYVLKVNIRDCSIGYFDRVCERKREKEKKRKRKTEKKEEKESISDT